MTRLTMTMFTKENLIKAALVLLCYTVVVSAVVSLLMINNNYLNPIYFFKSLLNYEYATFYYKTVLKVAISAPIFLIVLLVITNKNKKIFEKIYGDAHWANAFEIKRQGFFSKTGLIVGNYKGKLLRVKLSSHVLVFAPSRSGKGVSQVIPNALNWNGSMLITDIKCEVFEHTAGFRQKVGDKVFLFAPSHPEYRTHCYNPLDLVSRYDRVKRISELQLITHILIPSVSGDGEMWASEARGLAIGFLVWLADTDRPFNIGELNDVIKGTPDLSAFLQTLLNDSIIGENMIDIDTIAYQNLNNYLQKSEKERSGVRSTLVSHLSLWDDPLIRAATYKSDFNIKNMRRERICIYLGIPERDMDRLRPLVNLFIQQVGKALSEKIPGKDEPHKVLFLLDEICNLGPLSTIKKGMSFFAGYGIHIMGIIQNLAQGYEIYGKEGFDSFISNTDYKICYYQNDPVGAEFVSKLLGDKTDLTRSKSHKSFFLKQNDGFNDSYIARPLLSPAEVFKFPREKAIAIVSSGAPIKYDRIIYYTDERFTSRLLPPPVIDAISPMFAKVNISQVSTDSDRELNNLNQINEISNALEDLI